MQPHTLSHELREALGMPEGAPPPWLINMQVNQGMSCRMFIMLFCSYLPQRYGPPPSYPHLKIPGLNAPVPPGGSFGYHPGGGGKPPVDEVRFILLF